MKDNSIPKTPYLKDVSSCTLKVNYSIAHTSFDERLDEILAHYHMLAISDFFQAREDGIDRHSGHHSEATAAILALFTEYAERRETEIRIDELHRHYGYRVDTYGKEHYYPKRIAELEAAFQQPPTQKAEDVT